MTFDTWGQIFDYLDALNWPSQEQPWVLEDGKLIDPLTVISYLPRQ